MNIINHIKKIHETESAIPGKLYHIGLRVRETVPYPDSGNLHGVENFIWFEYIFGHEPGQITFNGLYKVLYDYKAWGEERDWFDKKYTDLFNLGFTWSESSGTFFLSGVWSSYWEQVNRYNEKEWAEYILAIKEAIKNKT
jgi:hypothetical protein